MGTSFKFSAAERKVVLDAYKQRWDMLYNRLHALGLVLNPLLHKFDGTCMVETRQYIDAYFAIRFQVALPATSESGCPCYYYIICS